MPSRIAVFRGVNWARPGEKQDAFKPNAPRWLPRLGELGRLRMDQLQVHYELFVRKTPAAPWALEMASENRAQVVETAETLMDEKRVAAVRVSKETLDEESREFQSVVIVSKGHVEAARKRKPVENREALCVSPQDLYSAHARDRIGRLLENWLSHHHATPFELLHRPDLIAKLDAAGN